MIICLASQSPRRKKLLEEAGYEVIVRQPHVDDARLRRPNVSPTRWIMSLAYLKARSVLFPSPHSGGGRGVRGEGSSELKSLSNNKPTLPCDLILAADTVCVVDNKVLGQANDADHAREMLSSMRNRAHTTMTGVCLLDPKTHRRMLAIDAATVTLGNVTDSQIEEYISSNEWRGKAGAYNLEERMEAGWPIECLGDPATVMGLPIKKLPTWLGEFEKQSPTLSPSPLGRGPG